LFLRAAEVTVERSCLCTACLKAFRCEHWRYAAAVPVPEAKSLPVEELLARTNPGLVERLHLKEQISTLGGDARFAHAYEQLEALRPGASRSGLLAQLLDWGRLSEQQRMGVTEQIASQARAWQFARQIAPTFPVPPIYLAAAVVAPAVGSVFLWLPAARSWLWGGATVVAGLGAAALGTHVLLKRKVRWWTREVLIPEAQDAKVSLACFVAVVDDVPGSRLGMLEELWPIKVELETIRGVLVSEGKL
jgi:hypothetical protein